MCERMMSRAFPAKERDKLFKLCKRALMTSGAVLQLDVGGEQHIMDKNNLESSAAADGTCRPELQAAGLPADAQEHDKRASACGR